MKHTLSRVMDVDNSVLVFRDLDARCVTKRLPVPHLVDREVHVWALILETSAEVKSQCWNWLSRIEQERAERLRFEQDRRHFIVAHGWLRHILAGYTLTNPCHVPILHAPGGKPQLDNEMLRSYDLRFNLTHSNGRALLALARGFEVGVDLEEIRDAVQHLKLSERFFSRTEWQTIKSCSNDRQREMFFRYWVGKESVMKAQGTGLLFPLDQCELAMSDGLDEAILGGNGQKTQEQKQKWIVRFLDLNPGWVGAVAEEGADWTVKYCTQGPPWLS